MERIIPALNAFRTSPTGISEAALRKERNTLVASWLEIGQDDLSALNEPERRAQIALLLACGLRVLPPAEDELVLLERARVLVETAADGPTLVKGLLCFCLLQPPHRLPRIAPLALVPADLAGLLIRILYTEPEFFTAFGEADRYVAYSERVTMELLQLVRGNRPLAERQRFAESFTYDARFLQTYFTERSLRNIFQARAQIAEFFLNAVGNPTEHDFPPRPADRRRLRVGVLRPQWLGGTETAATLAHLNKLDPTRFELVLYSFASNAANSFEVRARARADRFVVIDRKHVASALRQIREDDLDIMLIGTNVVAHSHFAFFLTACRLARVQIALTLSPATTGFAAVDYFLNGAANEPADAADHYTEKLLLIPGSINHYDFTGEPWADDAAFDRAALGLPRDAFVYISGANFYKLVPELLDSWAHVLAATPDSRLVLYPFNPNWSNVYPVDLFLRHVRGLFARRGVDPWRITVVMPQPTRAHIQALIGVADLYLDSFPFSGAVSVCDPVAAGCPIVMYQGRSARGRQSSGILAELDLGVAHATTIAGYEAEAVRLHGDREALNALRLKALAARDKARAMRALDLGPALLRVAGWNESTDLPL